MIPHHPNWIHSLWRVQVSVRHLDGFVWLSLPLENETKEHYRKFISFPRNVIVLTGVWFYRFYLPFLQNLVYFLYAFMAYASNRKVQSRFSKPKLS